jgi:prepilin-type N-terminal cleavage/methylation domain-containing protein
VSARGYTLIEVLIALVIVSLFSSLVFQHLSTLIDRVQKVQHEEMYQKQLVELASAFVGLRSGKSTIIQHTIIGFDVSFNCTEMAYLNTRFYECDYRTYDPQDPFRDIVLHNIEQLVLNSGAWILVSR